MRFALLLVAFLLPPAALSQALPKTRPAQTRPANDNNAASTPAPLSTAPPSIVVDWAGAKPTAAMVYDLNAASGVNAEAGLILKLTSDKGATSGTGPLSAFKIPFGTEMTMKPGAGNSYGMNSVIHANPGVGYVQVTGMEINVDINNRAYPPEIGQPFATSLLLGGISAFPQTAGIFVNDVGSATFLMHEGIWFYGAKTIKDHTFRDDTNSVHSIAIRGSHAGASILDGATTPAAIALSGTYSTAAIFTADSRTSNALIAAPGQNVCFNSVNGYCLRYVERTGRFYLSNAAGQNVFSIDGAGNVRAAGTITGSTAP
jgi:hypothetical protein